MVIAQIVESDAPGGMERLVIQITKDLLQRGHRVLVVGPADGPGNGWLGDEIRALKAEWRTVSRRWMLDPRAVTDLMRLFRAYRIDAVHSHEFAPSVFGAAAAWVTRRPHVITMHSNLYFATAWRRKAAFRWAARHSHVVAVSRDTAVESEQLLGLPTGTIHMVPNGIAPTAGRRDVLRKELALNDADVLVVAVGNVSPRKAHINLLRALIQLEERRPGLRWHLAIAGTDQGSAPEIREVAAAQGLSSRVHLLGHRADTENVLAAGDVYAMSSLHEGMPLAIIEAMFAGKAMISTSAGGIAEMFTEGEEGLLSPVGDVAAMSSALERLVTDAPLRERLGSAAQRRAAKQFGIAPMMDAYLKLYASR